MAVAGGLGPAVLARSIIALRSFSYRLYRRIYWWEHGDELLAGAPLFAMGLVLAVPFAALAYGLYVVLPHSYRILALIGGVVLAGLLWLLLDAVFSGVVDRAENDPYVDHLEDR